MLQHLGKKFATTSKSQLIRELKQFLKADAELYSLLQRAQEKQQLPFKSFINFGITVGTQKENTADQKFYLLLIEVF